MSGVNWVLLSLLVSYTSASAPPCQKASTDVYFNLKRRDPCNEAKVCLVVVNANAQTAEACAAWSPVAFWDPPACIGRCELIEGAHSATYCMANGSTSDPALLTAPIKCGAWLGVRDSAWEKSWFGSQCLQTLRRGNDPPRLTEYNASTPLCRESAQEACGVQVPCAELCPVTIFGLGEAIYSGMGVKSCDWFIARDAITYGCLLVWLVWMLCGCCYNSDANQPHFCAIVLFFVAAFFWELVPLIACLYYLLKTLVATYRGAYAPVPTTVVPSAVVRNAAAVQMGPPTRTV